LIMKLIIGFITYGDSTAKYLPYFLDSLGAQIYRDYKVLAVDNSEKEDNGNIKYLREHGVDFKWAGGNIGFARAYNSMIRQAVDLGADYFLVINPDIILEPDAAAKMVEALEQDGRLGSVCPKVLRWDFARNRKTDVIDTCGIRLRPGLRFVDAGQGERDEGRHDSTDILGPSGAAAMYRLEALGRVKEENGYFDETMFMYKEDCDLAYRLFLAGYQSRCVAGAVVYHDRTARAAGESDLRVVMNRKNKNKRIKAWSFLNQHILFLKYWRLQNTANKLAVSWYGLKMFIFVLLFEQYSLKQYRRLWKLRKKINTYGS